MSVSFATPMQVDLLLDLLLSQRVRLGAQLSKHELDGWILITPAHCFVHKSSIDLIDSDGQGLDMVLGQRELGHAKTSQLMLVR